MRVLCAALLLLVGSWAGYLWLRASESSVDASFKSVWIGAPAEATQVRHSYPSNPASPESATRRQLIQGRAYYIKSPPMDLEGDALEFVSQRLAAARGGSGLASYEIHLRTDSCRRVMKPGDQSVYLAYAREGLGQQYMRGVEKELQNCSKLLSSGDLLDENWLEQAAQQGEVEAQLLYARDPAATLGTLGDLLADPERALEYRRLAVSLLQRALQSGSLDALDALGNIYQRGILAPKDFSAAYANKLALQQIDAKPSRSAELAELRSILTPAEISSAEVAAKELRKTCCI
ncbi:sel1 repeat family protein [Stenotrophomonas rhizophila]|uniref:sel1 repeat family protein n=1 Tax=Stenotrophomonas rhizophila TaxID=216778 RepID=UPI00117CF539|nr:sel1 repeat family protein [Stenotrophomonas rhizophila]